MTAMLSKSAQEAWKAAFEYQYWLPAFQGSLTLTCVGETPLKVTACSIKE